MLQRKFTSGACGSWVCMCLVGVALLGLTYLLYRAAAQ